MTQSIVSGRLKVSLEKGGKKRTKGDKETSGRNGCIILIAQLRRYMNISELIKCMTYRISVVLQ